MFSFGGNLLVVFYNGGANLHSWWVPMGIGCMPALNPPTLSTEVLVLVIFGGFVVTLRPVFICVFLVTMVLGPLDGLTDHFGLLEEVSVKSFVCFRCCVLISFMSLQQNTIDQ